MSFVINNGVLERYDPEPCDVNIVIPDGVTKIGEKAFKRKNIISVVIPSSVKIIDEEAFSDCRWLTKVTLNNGLEKIKKCAFFGSSINKIVLPETIKTIGEGAFISNQIQSVNIPEKVKYIGKNCFLNCERLENISVSEKNQTYKSSDGVLFDKDMKTLICYPSAKKDSCYTVPDGVEVIQKHSFSFCNNLTSIIFSAGMKWIESQSFYLCGIRHITIPDCEMVISSKAFCSTRFSDITIIGRKTSLNVSADFRTSNGTLNAEIMRFINCITYAPCFKDKFFAEMTDFQLKAPVTVFLLIEYDYPAVKAYVNRSIRHIVKYIIDTGDAEKLTVLLSSGYVTKKNIGDFINYAIKRKSPEMQLILTKYKHDNLSFDTEDNFDKFLL